MSNAGTVEIHVDGRAHRVERDATLAAALIDLRISTRRSVTGEMRAPLCGMGICFECRVSIDGMPQQRACLVIVREGMRVATSEDRG